MVFLVKAITQHSGKASTNKRNLHLYKPNSPIEHLAMHGSTEEGNILDDASLGHLVNLKSTESDGSSEAGLKNSIFNRLGSIIPYGGLLSTTFNLASATLGGGVIS
ncbi:hypothetical protein DQ04_11411030, partial [Trypanosoma grayi]|uniref:hypothetical protein n=1 Tax=Trypanosoma grayi TaxID=71804 RepID=UPI0004F40213